MRWALLGSSLVISLVLAAPARACTPSSGGLRSFDLRLSPAAGIQCLHVVTVYDGPSCAAGSEVASETLHCSLTHRLSITDRGILISILAPRAARRTWPILQVFTIGDEGRVVRLALDELSGTAGLRAPRAVFDGDAVVFRDARSEARVSFVDLEARFAHEPSSAVAASGP